MRDYGPDYHKHLPEGLNLGDPERPEQLKVGQSLIAHLPPTGDCHNCRDPNGAIYVWTVTDNPRATPHWFNQTVRRYAKLNAYPCPVCRADLRTRWLVEHSGLLGLELEGKPAIDLRIRSFEPKAGQTGAWRVALALIEEIPKPTSPALFFGEPGTGKSHVLMCLVNACRVMNLWAHYTTSEAILRRLRSSFGQDSGVDLGALRAEYESMDALAIDELHAVNWTDWASEQLFAIIEARHLRGTATWFASSLIPSELRNLAPPLAAILSRVSAGYQVGLTAPDQRPEQRPLGELPEWVHE